MSVSIFELSATSWQIPQPDVAAINAIETGKVLMLPHLAFGLLPPEQALLSPGLLAKGSRNISLDAGGVVHGSTADAHMLPVLTAMIGRFRRQSQLLIDSLLPAYKGGMRLAPTSYRPMQVATRAQSWRADDRRLHVDAFPSRPNRGERILRVFSNINPQHESRVWRVGEPFDVIARRFLPRIPRYSSVRAQWLHRLGVTKSLRSEYDHIMLHLHDAMKADLTYQRDCEQLTVPFASGSTWVCFSDQTAHAVMSGQYMLEQTFHMSPAKQYDPSSSPLGVLQALTGRPLV
jgi:hypothetical protein